MEIVANKDGDPMITKEANMWRFATLIIALSLTLYYVLFVNMPRGTDQFWYLADTNTLINGNPPFSLNVFPGMVLRQELADPVTHFIHNSPLIYLNAWLGSFVGAFKAWQISGLFFLFTGATFTALAVSRVCGSVWLWPAALLYLVSPINLWMSGNSLQESYFGALTAILLYLTICWYQNHLQGKLLLVLLFIGALSHPLYVVMALAIGMLAIYEKKQWVIAVLMVLSALIGSKLGKVWFPSSFQPSLYAIVASAVPNLGNSVWQLSDQLPIIDLDFMIAKFKIALKRQFLITANIPFYAISNIAFIAIFYLLITRIREYRFYLFFCSALFGCYFGILILMQNQMRYQLLISAAAIFVFFLAIKQVRHRRFSKNIVLVLICAYLLVDSTLLLKLQKDGKARNAGLDTISEALAFLPKDARLASLDVGINNWISISGALAPRKTMLVDLDILEVDKVGKALDIYKADYILTQPNVTPPILLAGSTLVRTFSAKTYPTMLVYKTANANLP